MKIYEMIIGTAVKGRRIISGLGDISKFTDYLKSIEYKSEDEILALQAEEMSKFLKYAVENVPFYRSFNGELELSPETVHEDILNFPILSKQMIEENYTALTSEVAKGKKFRTGGTTGKSMLVTRDRHEVIHSANEYFNQMGDTYPGKSRLLIRRAESVYFAENPHDKIYSGNFISRAYSVSPAFMDNERLELLYKVYSKHKPKVISGITDPVYRFAQYILDERLKTYPIDSLLLGGQTMMPKHRETIERAFGKNTVYDRYGATEFGLLAQQCDRFGGRHYVPVVHHVEVVDEDCNRVEPGTLGQFIVTNLQKRAMPLIRYKVDDLAVMDDKKCSCGRSFPMIRRFEGRRIESIVSPKHTYMTPLPFYDIMEEFYNVDDFLVEQRAENTVTIMLKMKSGEFAHIQQLALRKEINRYLDYPMKLNIEYIDKIVPMPNGKVLRVKGYENFINIKEGN